MVVLTAASLLKILNKFLSLVRPTGFQTFVGCAQSPLNSGSPHLTQHLGFLLVKCYKVWAVFQPSKVSL